MDIFTRTLTLVVPTIFLSPGDEVDFDAFAIETIDHSGTFTNAGLGSQQIYRIHQIAGKAQHVAFLTPGGSEVPEGTE